MGGGITPLLTEAAIQPTTIQSEERATTSHGDRTSMDLKLHAANRFGLGPRPAELGGIGDPREWLLAQLRPEAALLDAEGLPTLQDAADAFARSRREQQERAAAGESAPSEREVDGARAGVRNIVAAEQAAALDRRLTTSTPFVERLVAFWSNHLCVSPAGKVRVLTLPGLYERQVIRPHVLGKSATWFSPRRVIRRCCCTSTTCSRWARDRRQPSAPLVLTVVASGASTRTTRASCSNSTRWV
ncbi:MAG: DUF1800 family protein [Acidobacteria bacterium]|nr:DUF1800 family protein [Acidobacteriota bacterium]